MEFRAPQPSRFDGGSVGEIQLFDREAKIWIRVARRPQQAEAQLRGVRRDDARAELRRGEGRESRSRAELQDGQPAEAAAPGVRKPLKRRDRGDARRPDDGAHRFNVAVDRTRDHCFSRRPR